MGRHTVSNAVPQDRRRKQVFSTLQKYPICNLYDLARCSPRRWSGISRELGGVSHGDAMRIAAEYVQKSMCPLDRASFWTSVGTRTKVVDHGRVCGFAGDQFAPSSTVGGWNIPPAPRSGGMRR